MSEKVIFKCMKCKQKLRVPVIPHKTLKVTCPKCSAEIDFNCDKYIGKQALAKTINLLLIITFFIIYIALPFLFKFKTDSTIAHLNKKHEDEKTQLKANYSDELVVLKEKHIQEVKKINLTELTHMRLCRNYLINLLPFTLKMR